ncbi:MAG: hydantoinase B/oxoprolinase family protein, partial [Candidatus Scalindua sp.]
SPYGLRSGKKGRVGKNILISRGKKQNLPSKTTVNVEKGDIISICTPGGGGYGKEKEVLTQSRRDHRENEKTARDIKPKTISNER